MAWDASHDFTTGEVVTEATMDQLIANFLAIGGPRTAWTPQIDQGATTNIAKTVTYAKYITAGTLVIASGLLAVTAAGTASAGITVSLPVLPVQGGSMSCGSAYLSDASSVITYGGIAVISSLAGTGLLAMRQGGTSGAVGSAGSAFAGALASGDVISFAVHYEAA